MATSIFELVELDFMASWDMRTSQDKIKVLETLLSAFNDIEDQPIVDYYAIYLLNRGN